MIYNRVKGCGKVNEQFKMVFQGTTIPEKRSSFFLSRNVFCPLQISVLVHEMILTEVWKQKIFPILCQLQDFTPKNTFPLYMVVSA